MNLIDTHAHIFEDAFDADRAEVVCRAKQVGVECLILPNIDSSTIKKLYEVCGEYNGYCYPLLGIHPTSVDVNYKAQLNELYSALDSFNYIGIGEIGIDLYWDKTYLKEQQIVFEQQVEIAISKGLPISIHCRDAFGAVVESLQKFDSTKIKGVFHAFSGGKDQWQVINKLGDFCIGIGGVATYKNAKFPQGLPDIPIERVLLETDCPYLSPVPHRGKRNEPSYVLYVAQKLAEVYGMEVEKIGEITTKNAKALFF